MEIIVMNREAFEALTSQQQEILRRAGRDVLDAELARLEREERAGLVAVCERGARSLVTASVGGVRSLREAVQPVYDELERDPLTRDWIAEIAELREEGQGAASALSCPEKDASPKSDASKLEGRWTVNWTLEELLAAGDSPRAAAELRGRHVVEFSAGRFGPVGGRPDGTYTVDGDVIRLVFRKGVGGVAPGKVYELEWSVYRDSLSFAAVPGRTALPAMLIRPFTRVR
jgi:hypothetical protein